VGYEISCQERGEISCQERGLLCPGGDEMRSRPRRGTTYLRAICPDCKSVATMSVKSVIQVCSSVDIRCSHCAALNIVYKRGM
jgi:phage FluMu protein Com